MDNIIFDIYWLNYNGERIKHKVAIPFRDIENCDIYFKKYYKTETDTKDETKVKTKNNIRLQGKVISFKQNVLKIRMSTIKKLLGFERKVEQDKYVKTEDIEGLSSECSEYTNQVRYWSLPPPWNLIRNQIGTSFYENENTWKNNVLLPTLSKLPMTPPACNNYIPSNRAMATTNSYAGIWGDRTAAICKYCGNNIDKHRGKMGGNQSRRRSVIRKIKSRKRKTSRR